MKERDPEPPNYAARELLPLPPPHRLMEVWCGSEFTLAADQHGGVWGCGWNEHGNLGCGFAGDGISAPWTTTSSENVLAANNLIEWKASKESAWRRAYRRLDNVSTTLYPISLSVLWEGALACGGCHVIALAPALP